MSQEAPKPSVHKWSKAACFLVISLFAIGLLIAGNVLMHQVSPNSVVEYTLRFLWFILITCVVIAARGRIGRSPERPKGHRLLTRTMDLVIISTLPAISTAIPPISVQVDMIKPIAFVMVAIVLTMMALVILAMNVANRRLRRSHEKRSD